MTADPNSKPDRPRSRLSGWRGLAAFWVVLLAVVGGGVGVLQWLDRRGPAEPAAEAVAKAPEAASHGHGAEATPAPQGGPDAAAPPPPAAARAEAALMDGRPIPESNVDFEEPAPHVSGLLLPRIAADGRKPMDVFAAGFDRENASPRVALLLAGMAMTRADDEEALKLPPSVSFALNPYAPYPGRLVEAAHAIGHEVWLGVPMEPQGYPVDDPGPLAMLTTQAAELNAERLERVMGLTSGYVGLTNAIGALRGERFSGTEGVREVLNQAASRGLLFLDARPGATLLAVPQLAARGVDVVVDQPAVAQDIDAQLAKLTELARTRGSAIGVVGTPAPVTLQRLAEWVHGLARERVALVPVSSLIPRGAVKK